MVDLAQHMVEALGRDSQVATAMAGSWRPSVKEVVAAAKQCQGAPGPDSWQPDELSQLLRACFCFGPCSVGVERQVFPEVWQRTTMIGRR